MARKVKTLNFHGTEFPSQTEAIFYAWLLEARDKGLVTSWKMQCGTVLWPKATYTEIKHMKTKTKEVEKTLFHPWTYTSDFVIFAPKALAGLGHPEVFENGLAYTIDTKGDHINPGQAAMFSVKQKAMWHLHKVYVNKVQPSKFYRVAGFPAGRLPDESYMHRGELKQPWRRLRDECKKIGEAV